MSQVSTKYLMLADIFIFLEMNEIVYFSVWAVERTHSMTAEKIAEINFAFYPQSKKRRGVESFR